LEPRQQDEQPVDKSLYPFGEAVGCLLYLANCTRPDLAFAANTLAKFLSNPAARHWALLKHVLGYLHSTQSRGITFGTSKVPLVVYCDSDFAGDKYNRKSRTGFVALAHGGPVTWCSKAQTVMATSSTEAEYTALAACAREVTWLRRMATFLCIDTTLPTTVQCDNQASICIAQGTHQSSRTKHFDVSAHYIRDSILRCKVKLEYVPTKDNVADYLTKPLPKEAFNYLLAKCSVA
jgi:hypothetical protein